MSGLLRRLGVLLQGLLLGLALSLALLHLIQAEQGLRIFIYQAF